ncbi:MAG TPA: tyrosine-type recombinase/integrase [Thermoanaerobaculia bacterium]
MSRHPGFSYDAATKRAHFNCYVPGTAGKLRRRRTISVETRAEALGLWRAFLDELAAEAIGKAKVSGSQSAAREVAVDEVAAMPTLREFIDAQFETIAAGLKPSTQRSHRSIIANRLLPEFGDTKLDAINSIAALDFKVRMKNGRFAPSYVNDCVRVLKMLLHQAVERDVIPSYPLKKRVRKEKEPLLRLEMTDAERSVFLQTFDNFGAFAAYLAGRQKKGQVVESAHFGSARVFGGGLRGDSDAARDYFARFAWLKPLFIVALETGLRKGDLLKLTWSSIDFAEGWIRLVMEKTAFEATIPISAECQRALETGRARPVVSPFVFVDEQGRRISETRLRRTYAIAKKLAGITRRCRFHDLRHTFASRLVSRGVSLRVVATALGHTTTEQTERYAKPSEAAMREIKTALDRDAGSR